MVLVVLRSFCEHLKIRSQGNEGYGPLHDGETHIGGILGLGRVSGYDDAAI